MRPYMHNTKKCRNDAPVGPQWAACVCLDVCAMAGGTWLAPPLCVWPTVCVGRSAAAPTVKHMDSYPFVKAGVRVPPCGQASVRLRS